MRNSWFRCAAIAVLALTLGACESVGIVPDAPPPTAEPSARSNNGGLIETLFGGSDQGVASGGIAVNSYLWRASLDTMSFMPLSSADPFGGVIITDWYTPPETPNERVKVNIYILDRQLRADGLRISVFRQARDGGSWQQASVDPQTIRDIENAILRRARELRIANLRAQ
ncbi:MAG: hypothetical protein CFH40_00984 [Alphaproteobacteria bacterium MarineAlpha10_Bin3]|jgi:hypothetical protein|nr:MAG: hypothetical protein CFH40_00984 [Alphaproteobacteria bacterium MarineAlpha10_Bin3]PPR72280.1 MAG: hypothetical protein CFH09_00984 [Alphaproteobacteria bacterium MarineAlpha4_Bin1]